MPETITVTLQPTDSGELYATPHKLEISSANDAGKTIIFKALESGFGVYIPKADEFFDTTEKHWSSSIRARKSKETPAIQSGLALNPDGFDYYVYCEQAQDWADKPGASPPKIIIVP